MPHTSQKNELINKSEKINNSAAVLKNKNGIKNLTKMNGQVDESVDQHPMENDLKKIWMSADPFYRTTGSYQHLQLFQHHQLQKQQQQQQQEQEKKLFEDKSKGRPISFVDYIRLRQHVAALKESKILNNIKEVSDIEKPLKIKRKSKKTKTKNSGSKKALNHVPLSNNQVDESKKVISNIRKQLTKKVQLPKDFVEKNQSLSLFNPPFTLPKQYTDNVNDSNMEENLNFWRELKFVVPRTALKYRITKRLNKLAKPKNFNLNKLIKQRQKQIEIEERYQAKMNRMSPRQWKSHQHYLNCYLACPRRIIKKDDNIDRGKKVHLKQLLNRINHLAQPKTKQINQKHQRCISPTTSVISKSIARSTMSFPYQRKVSLAVVRTQSTPSKPPSQRKYNEKIIPNPSKRIIQLATPRKYFKQDKDQTDVESNKGALSISGITLGTRSSSVSKYWQNKTPNRVRLLYLSLPKRDYREEYLKSEKEKEKHEKLLEKRLNKVKRKAKLINIETRPKSKPSIPLPVEKLKKEKKKKEEMTEKLGKLNKLIMKHRAAYRREYQMYKDKLRLAYSQVARIGF